MDRETGQAERERQGTQLAPVSPVFGWIDEEIGRARLNPEAFRRARREAQAARRERMQQAHGQAGPQPAG